MKPSDNLELKISQFLRYGVLLSGGLILIGWVKNFRFQGNPFFNFQIYDQIPFLELFNFHLQKGEWGILVSYAGLITLITLPLFRVILLVFLFLRQKEMLLALISFVVILLLILSMSLGLDI